MANLSIKSKLLVMLLAVSLFSIAVVASLNYYTCFKALQDAVFSHLTSVRASRADQIQLFIERLRTEVRVIGNRGVASDAARDFIKAYQELDKIAVDPAVDLQLRKYYQGSFVPALGKATGTEPEVNTLLPDSPAGRYLQYQYLAKNPFPVGEKAADPLAMYLTDLLTIPSNMAGLPGLSIPCGLSEGLPVGFQLTGPQFSENVLFRAGHALERAIGFDVVPERLK